MKIKVRGIEKSLRKFQEGGAMPAEGAPEDQMNQPTEAPVGPEGEGGGGEDPLMQLALIFQLALQSQDCQMLAQGAQMFLQLIQQASQQQASAQEPVFKKGGKLLRYVTKK